MAININDFINNVVLINDNALFKIEENYFYVYPYGDKFDKIFYMFNFVDKKSISEKGIYRNCEIIANAAIEKVNKRFYLNVLDNGKSLITVRQPERG